MNEQSPFTESRFERSKSLKVKEWAINRLKQGSSPNKVAFDIQKLFNVYVSMMCIYRWRKKYIAATGEYIPRWKELNKTVEQQNKNKCSSRSRTMTSQK